MMLEMEQPVAIRRAAAPPAVLVVFRNDDPSALSDVDHERRVADIFDRYGVPQVLGVIPNCTADGFRNIRGTKCVPLDDNAAMVEFLREYSRASGSEIALHGYTHRTNRVSIPSRREFFEFRDVGEQEQREWIAAGTAIVQRTLGERPITFIPPWNRLDSATTSAARQCGYRIISAGPYAPISDDLIAVGTSFSISDVPTRLDALRTTGRTALFGVLFHSRTTRSAEDLAQLESAVRAAAEAPECRVLTARQVADEYAAEMALINRAARNVVPQDELLDARRARAVVYRRAARAFGRSLPVESVYREAQRSFDAAMYHVAAEQTVALDHRVSKSLLASRGLMVACGASLAILANLASGSFGLPFRLTATALLGVLIVVAAWAISRKATAAGTIAEIRLAGLLVAAGLAGVGVLTEWARTLWH